MNTRKTRTRKDSGEAFRPDRTFGRVVMKWTSDGTVIRLDWDSLQRMVAVARLAGALPTAE